MRSLSLSVIGLLFVACAPADLPGVAPDAASDVVATDTSPLPIDAPDGAADASAVDVVDASADVARDANCPAHAERVGAACRCVAGYTVCDGRCVDLFNDGANCGACASLCEGGICALGRCVAVAPPPDAGRDAGDAAACVSMTPGNCCGVACPTRPHASAATCAEGRCGIVCDAGFGDCDGNLTNGCETDVSASTSHCGACGAACAAGRACVRSACVCPPLRGDCDGDATNGCELDIGTSDLNCGACGRACARGQFCTGGNCRS